MNEVHINAEPILKQKLSPRLRLTTRKTASQFLSVEQSQKENERLKRDIFEKDSQIAHFEVQVKMFKECSQAIRKLISDLEASTGAEFLTKDQRKNFDHMPHNEGILVIKKAMNYLIKEYEILPDKFSQEFAEKANKLGEELDRVEKNTKAVLLQKHQLQKDLKKLDRIISIDTSEKNSLQQIADSLQEQLNEQANDSKSHLTEHNAQLNKLRNEIQKTTMESLEQNTLNAQINQQLISPIPKRHRDMLKDDQELEAEYEKLTKYLEKERSEHNLTKKQLEHTNDEIARANETIQRYKANVNPDTMRYAASVNKSMRHYIRDQREEQKRKLLSQIKKNKDLERQINEMQEEQSMLIPYLAQVEKKLQAEMLKLPSLNDIQHRNEPEPKRALTKLNKRELDDAEMKSVKRTITRMKAKRLRAKTAIGSR